MQMTAAIALSFDVKHFVAIGIFSNLETNKHSNQYSDYDTDVPALRTLFH